MMLKEALYMQKTKKFIIQGIIFFLFFLFIYFIIDYLNMSYLEMQKTFGLYLVILNIGFNILMALLSTLMMNLSTAMAILKGKESKASNFGFLSILFGILTYGCTSCVITFFASIGIAFSVIALPLAGFPYKIISLLLLLIGLYFVIKALKNPYCKVKKPKKDKFSIDLEK